MKESATAEVATAKVPSNAPSEEWSKTFGGADYDCPNSVQQTSDGGYIFAGETSSCGAGSVDLWLVKTDPVGNKVWDKTFGGAHDDGARSVQKTSDGEYIIAGETSSYGAGSFDFWLVKTDSARNKEWDKTFGGEDSDKAESVQQTSDAGYIIAGHSGGDAWLIKTDSAGNKEWDRTFGGAASDEARSVQQTSDGGYIIAGDTSSYGAGYADFWLVKTDSAGNEEWDKTFGGESDDKAEVVQQTSDGGYIIAGYAESYYDPYGASGGDAWLIKLAPA